METRSAASSARCSSGEVTVARSTCGSCGAVREIGALAVYVQAPGAVARCPGCDAVLLRVVRGEGRIWLELQGVSCLELRAQD